ncbi:MAG TPA: 50S ribosomal protein L13 [Anaerolineales bacterium]|nr:50S ribosomal protein L13 [Anaerolineales bacterium]
MQKTYIPKSGDVTSEWKLVDANSQNLGRLATQISTILLGKDKPIFTPGVDTGDYVIVVNAELITVTGNKLDDKFYYRHSGYPGGLKKINLRDQLARHPDRVIRQAVWGMIPHNRYGRKLIKKLRIYSGPDHPHQAQDPTQVAL